MEQQASGRTPDTDRSAFTQRIEWRFFWPHAEDDMNGARWRSEPPSKQEFAEWREDLPTCWVERRMVYEGRPERTEL